MRDLELWFDVTPYRLSGAVYGVLLNHREALNELGDAVNLPPYKARPNAPVLYIKPRNTLTHAAPNAPATVVVPADAVELEVGATLGIVIGCTACRVSRASALDHVAGYTIVNDVSVPHTSFYRPSVRLKARDGFCPIGPRVVASDDVANPDDLAVHVYVDGSLVQRTSTGGMLRPVAALIADVTEFMTLAPGDVLMLGVAAGAPHVRAGQRVAIEIAGLGRLENAFVAERLLESAA